MMRTPAYLCLLLTCMLISCTPTQEKHEIDYTSYVNPFIGTDFTGNTYPGAQAPFGMVQLSPDNGLPGWDRISGYFYPDSTIAGFSHTHLSGTGAGDLYDISFMPVIKATTMHIPVILGAVLLGPAAGAVLGAVFGLWKACPVC